MAMYGNLSLIKKNSSDDNRSSLKWTKKEKLVRPNQHKTVHFRIQPLALFKSWLEASI